jgi:hypothetical protein
MTQITSLSADRFTELALALLDFTTLGDLRAWLESLAPPPKSVLNGHPGSDNKS